MPPITSIRDFDPADADKLWSVLERSLAAYGLKADSCNTDTDLLDVQRNYIDCGGRFRVLTQGETPIGMYGLYKIGAERVELRKMYLEPAHKGRGYGKLLLNDALSVAREAGFRTMTLETNRLLVEAIGLYRKFGFKDVERNDLSARCDRAMIKEL
jgi:putative acetyltransferase